MHNPIAGRLLWFGLFSRWFYFRAKGKRAKLRIQRNVSAQLRSIPNSNSMELQAVIDTRSVNFNNTLTRLYIVWGGSSVGTANINSY